jgi:hypothetical protein
MRRLVALGFAILLLAPAMLAQPGSAWLPCPRCQTPQQAAAAAKAGANRAVQPRDISGIWGNNGVAFTGAPPMTPAGQAKFDATKPGMGPRAVPLGNDPMMICDPLGYPRSLNYNYGMEFVQLPGRVVQFFEFDHTYRTIWTDGRALPDEPDPRWLGYAVGRWDGETLVVESAGFDDRSWLTTQGFVHSDRMRLTERFRRTRHDTLEVTLTITDPVIYTVPWTIKGTLTLAQGTELGEYFCVPSEEEAYRKTVREPAGGIVGR